MASTSLDYQAFYTKRVKGLESLKKGLKPTTTESADENANRIESKFDLLKEKLVSAFAKKCFIWSMFFIFSFVREKLLL